MKIDLHVHTSDFSDGRDSAEDVICAAIGKGLDGIAISDHDYMLQEEDITRIMRKFPGSNFKIFRAAEVSVRPLREHVLLIGGTGEQIPKFDDINMFTLDVLKDYVKRTGAFAVFCHPFWISPGFKFSFDDFRPDAMDILSMNTDTGRSDEYLATAKKYGMQLIAASDAHTAEQVGLFHIDTDRDVETDEELVRELRAGRMKTATFDDMWLARTEEAIRNEKLARKVLNEGGGLGDYLARGGHKAFFSRVVNGGSHLPKPQLLGVRGSDFGILAMKS